MNKKISLIIPTIGRVDYLDLLLKSVFQQKIKADEIIVFDNSKDQNLSILSKYGGNSLVTWLCSGGHLDAIESWNQAILSASCDYVSVIGDDDVLLPNYISECGNIISKVEFGILKAFSIDSNGIVIEILPYPKRTLLASEQFRHLRLKRKISLFVPGVVFKKNLFIEAGMFSDTEIDGYAYADELLYFKLAVLSRQVMYSREECWKYRIHSNQIGGIRSLDGYIDKCVRYVTAFEHVLITYGVDPKRIYPKKYSRQVYIDQLSKGVLSFTHNTINLSRKSSLNAIYSIKDNYFFDGRVSFKSKLILMPRIIYILLKSIIS